MKRLFNVIKEKMNKRKNNKKKYGAKMPLFAIGKKKRMKKRQVRKQYNIALNEYYKIRSIIEKNIENYKITKVAINRCFGPAEILNDLQKEQEEYISILNESQERLYGVVREELEKWSWINRKRMLKPECFQLWIIKKERESSNSLVEPDNIDVSDFKPLNVSNLDLTDEERSEYSIDTSDKEEVLVKNFVPTSKSDKRARYNISSADLQNLQFVKENLSSKQKNRFRLSNPENLHGGQKVVIRFKGSNHQLGNYFGVAGIVYDGKPLEEKNGIKSYDNLENNDMFSIDDKYSECKEEARGAMLDYLARLDNLDDQYNILEFEGIKNELTFCYSTKISELEDEYRIKEYRNEYKYIEENYSSYPRFASILKETLREKQEKFYHKSLSDFEKKSQNLNDKFEMEINSLNNDYSISEYMNNKYNLEKDLSNYRILLEEDYGKEMVDSVWNELSIELNEYFSKENSIVLVNKDRSYKK